MNTRWARALSVEIFWLALIALFVILSIIPLYGVITDNYLQQNITLALLFAFYFRSVIFFNQIPYFQPLAIQVLLFLGHIPLFVTVLGKIQDMIYLFDTYDIRFFFNPAAILSPDAMIEKFQLFRSEFLLFSVGSLILIVMMELRIILAFIQRIKKIE